jgi:hypothetical protein
VEGEQGINRPRATQQLEPLLYMACDWVLNVPPSLNQPCLAVRPIWTKFLTSHGARITVLSPGPSWLNSRKSRTTRHYSHKGKTGRSVNPSYRLSSADPSIPFIRGKAMRRRLLSTSALAKQFFQTSSTCSQVSLRIGSKAKLKGTFRIAAGFDA